MNCVHAKKAAVRGDACLVIKLLDEGCADECPLQPETDCWYNTLEYIICTCVTHHQPQVLRRVIGHMTDIHLIQWYEDGLHNKSGTKYFGNIIEYLENAREQANFMQCSTLAKFAEYFSENFEKF